MPSFEITAYSSRRASIALSVFLTVTVAASAVAWWVQQGLGTVEVANVTFTNDNGAPVRAKLFRPVSANPKSRAPGVACLPGYQSTRESNDAGCIELARRGFVVLSVDPLGRGNSGLPGQLDDPGFDDTFGGRSACRYLRVLPYVDSERIGLMGHSLGAEMMYKAALDDPAVQALVLTGFAYDSQASPRSPRNMLMIFGRWDEFRGRMTGTRHFEAEWMNTPLTHRVIPADDPRFNVTYGDFADGTARRVAMLPLVHQLEQHSHRAIAEVLEWMRSALRPDEELWIDARAQIWQVKEWATLIAMVAGFCCLLPLAYLLLGTRLFGRLRAPLSARPAASAGHIVKHSAINALLMWLYIPLILVLFAIHAYVVRIDRAFPMMVVNAIVWWFLWSNVIGFFLFRRWYRRRARAQGVSLADLGISYASERLALDWRQLGMTALLALVLFLCVYALEHVLEAVFTVDFRFIFAFANDLTPYRVLMVLLYAPFLLVGFLFLGFFLYGQVRPPLRATLLGTFRRWSVVCTSVVVVPLLILMGVQYVPLLLADTVLLTGPGDMLVLMLINVAHIIGVLLMVIPVGTWCFLLTGRPYLGALLSALLVAWMFASSQVIAPMPVDVG
jgi:dienelactone hydrolase